MFLLWCHSLSEENVNDDSSILAGDLYSHFLDLFKLFHLIFAFSFLWFVFILNFDALFLPFQLLSTQKLYETIRNEPFKIPEDDGNDLTHTFFNPDREGWLLKLGKTPLQNSMLLWIIMDNFGCLTDLNTKIPKIN